MCWKQHRLIYCAHKFTTEVQQGLKGRMHQRKDINRFLAELGANLNYWHSLRSGSRSTNSCIKHHKIICNWKDRKKGDKNSKG